MKTRRGTNQYKARYHKDIKSHLIFFVSLLFFFTVTNAYVNLDNFPPKANAEILSPIASPSASLNSEGKDSALPQLEVTTPVEEGPSQKDIEAYIKTIFGKDSKVAIAVSHVECNPANKAYPKCVYHTQHEYSVGIFQINLFNANQWIHAAKVPGETMEEKIESLKDPYINTLVAYKIFSAQGFLPWAGYTSGRYLDQL